MKRPAAVVAEEALAADAADPEIGIAVVVGVEEHQPGAGDVDLRRQPHRGGDVGEGAVGGVAVEAHARAAEQRDVLEAVAVDVGDRQTRAGAHVAEQAERRRAVDVVHVVEAGGARVATSKAGACALTQLART